MTTIEAHIYTSKLMMCIMSKSSLGTFIDLYMSYFKEYPANNLVEQYKEIVGIDNPEDPDDHSYDVSYEDDSYEDESYY